MTSLYLPCWMNVAGYVAGMAVAFLLHRCQLEGIRMSEKKVHHVTETDDLIELFLTLFIFSAAATPGS